MPVRETFYIYDLFFLKKKKIKIAFYFLLEPFYELKKFECDVYNCHHQIKVKTD